MSDLRRAAPQADGLNCHRTDAPIGHRSAKALGISYSALYQMMNQGDIEWVAVGSRKFVSRESLMDFIKANTHKGYYVVR
jgi:hypothetical protein